MDPSVKTFYFSSKNCCIACIEKKFNVKVIEVKKVTQGEMQSPEYTKNFIQFKCCDCEDELCDGLDTLSVASLQSSFSRK